ncbi:MAG: O-antigen ligase family protein [Terracidiphilus sp.]
MNSLLATCIFACGIAGLFYLDRDKTVRTSKALWIPVIWIAIVGSRSVSEWFGVHHTGANAQLDGSGIDAAVFGILTVSAIIVLCFRNARTRDFLVLNWPVLIYFFFCLISVSWSDHPDVSFKRWIKAIGDLAMVLVIVTDRQPVAALTRLMARVGFVLLPASVLMIKYFGDLGHEYTPDGAQMNTGVSTNKNMLGVMLLVVTLFTLWRVIDIFRDRNMRDRRRHLVAQGVLLAFGILLFKMAHSATAIACFALGGGLIIASNLRSFRIRPVRIHALCLGILLFGAVAFLSGAEGTVSEALGRQANLSGRTEIWAAAIPAAPNALIGAGFEDFWISPNVEKFQRGLLGWWHPEGLNEAHNGYIETYLNLGVVGVCLIAMILVIGYRRAVKAFRKNTQIGGLFLAYIIVAAVYSITEAGFRMLDPMWIFLLLAVVGASGVNAGLFARKATKTLATRTDDGIKTLGKSEPDPGLEAIYASRGGSAMFKLARANNPR